MNHKYTKGEKRKEFRDAISSLKVSVNQNETFEEKNLSEKFNLSDKYTKTDGNLDPSLFIIVSGGEEREKDYFSFFEVKKYSFPRIKIEFVSKDENGIGGLDVDSLVKVSLNIKKEKEKSKGGDIIDSINIVTDVDHFYPQLEKNMSKCESENLNLIISNPCFEIWLYYTHIKNKPVDFEIPKKELKISSKFKTYLDTKIKGGADPRKAPLKIKTAIENSLENYSEDKNKIPEIFSTNMHILAAKLYELTKEEIEIVAKKNEERKQKYMKNKKNR